MSTPNEPEPDPDALRDEWHDVQANDAILEMQRNDAARKADTGWPFDKNHTETDLSRLRDEAVGRLRETGIPVTGFTCDQCPSRYCCDLAFDPYNTGGDCLADK